MKKHWPRNCHVKAYRLVGIVFVLFGVGGVCWFFLEVAALKKASAWVELKAPSRLQINLPKDDAPHESKMEWWYYNGYLQSKTGQFYSFHDTTFLVNGVMATMANHISLSGHQTREHFIDQRSTLESLASGTPNQFDFSFGDWRMSGGNGVDRLQATSAKFGFNLQLKAASDPLLHGNNGVLPLGQDGSSYYYSRPRMAVAGTLDINGHHENVTGLAWFDHQWGDFVVSALAWDWFSLQLGDGTDVMLYQLRGVSDKPVLYTGTIVSHGQSELLGAGDFSLAPYQYWLSTETNIRYPVGWHLKIPGRRIDVKVTSFLENNEFDATLTTYNIYWEGAVQVTGTHAGKGFMELYGYKASKNPDVPN